MPVNSVGSASSVSYVGDTEQKNKKGSSVDMDTFLKLLVAQLQYQDPLEPQENTDFVTQLGQMTTMEQMQQMNASLSGSKAYDMMGKYVYAEVLNPKTGTVDGYLGYVNSVILKNGEYYAVLKDMNTAVPVSKVLQVFDKETVEEAAKPQTDPAKE